MLPTVIRFMKSLTNAARPEKATAGAAAFDLISASVEREGDLYIVNTGLRTSFPKDQVLLVFGRSGMARKFGIQLANSVGVIDSDYRGDLQLMFRVPLGTSEESVQKILGPGCRVAQAILMPITDAIWVKHDNLDESDRGTGGFGSTGHR